MFHAHALAHAEKSCRLRAAQLESDPLPGYFIYMLFLCQRLEYEFDSASCNSYNKEENVAVSFINSCCSVNACFSM